ncbi:uncharacterized protein [Amphiura filiformis]|uniref:uncharacterized protein n=1 Tax=Amphiura filiformis TaxID=82378 RepID=UPI003B22588D
MWDSQATIEAATTEATTRVTTEATTEATTRAMTEVTTGVTTGATTGATTTDEVTTEHEITTTQNMTPMKMDTTTTGVQSISAFENVASIFPYNATPGTITNNSELVFYLFEHKNREEDFQFDSEGDLALTIPKEFLASGLHNGTGYLTVVIKKTPTDDTEYWGDDSGEVYHLLGSALVSINLFSINGTLRKHEDEYNPLNISFPIKDPRSRNTSKQTKYSKLVCAFWDVENTMWSQEGSLTYKADTSDKLQSCGFTHLTTFAVLFEFSKETNILGQGKDLDPCQPDGCNDISVLYDPCKQQRQFESDRLSCSNHLAV